MRDSFNPDPSTWVLPTDRVILPTPTGQQTTASFVPHIPDRPPLTVLRGQAWHYTSLSALQSILRGQELWATSWKATNDTTELLHGISFLRRAWDGLIQSGSIADRTVRLLREAGPVEDLVNYFDHINMLCASRERDSPYQWNSYAHDSSGVALGLELSRPLITDIDDRPRRLGADLLGVQWLKVVYTARQKELAAQRFVREMDSALRRGQPMGLEGFVALNVATALNFKHAAFRNERETRCVSLSSGVDLQSMPMNSEKTIVPWISITEETTADRMQLPITEVLLSPRATDETSFAVAESLKSAGLSHIPIVRSDLPFR